MRTLIFIIHLPNDFVNSKSKQSKQCMHMCYARMREVWDIDISLNLPLLHIYETIIITQISMHIL